MYIPFGKYVLLEQIGSGGMGDVFKAMTLPPNDPTRLIAIKRIAHDKSANEEYIIMLVDEARLAVQLCHPNIAQIFDLGKAGDYYFMAMDFVSGKTLHEVIKQGHLCNNSLPLPMACYVAMKLCEGLDHAHNQSDASGRPLHIVHQDVGPQNIMLSYDGEIKLLDFGVARASNRAGRSRSGIRKGKPAYMSPEQVRCEDIDRRSDVFSIGTAMYEMIAGYNPFLSDSLQRTVENVVNLDPNPVSRKDSAVPEELASILAKALHKLPEQRYQSAMDLHDDIQSFMYTSLNFYSRNDLTKYIRSEFAGDYRAEAARNRVLESVDDGLLMDIGIGFECAHGYSYAHQNASANKIIDATDIQLPGTKDLAEQRIAWQTLSNIAAGERLLRAVQQGVESEFANDMMAKEEMRLGAAFGAMQSVTRVLLRRLSQGRESLRALYGGLCVETGPLTDAHFGLTRFDAWLRSGRQPSLAVVGGWLRASSRLVPSSLASAVQSALRVPIGMEDIVFSLGEARNVLAHRPEYEASRQSLGAASAFLSVEHDPMDAEGRCIRVSDAQLETILQACMNVVSGTDA